MKRESVFSGSSLEAIDYQQPTASSRTSNISVCVTYQQHPSFPTLCVFVCVTNSFSESNFFQPRIFN